MLLRLLDTTNPAKCRFLARKNGGKAPMSHEDVARRSGLHRATVIRLSHRTTWKGIPPETIDAFCRGCGIDILRPGRRRDKRVIRAGALTLLRKAKPVQRRMLARMLELLGGHRDNRGMPTCANQGALS